MRVGVDEARHRDHAAGVDDLASAAGVDGAGRFDRADAVSPDGNIVIGQHIHVALAGDV
ncbi:MAG: hypothetical protein MAG451_00141 [Anaerolineales bacterium]|nr:hypothetical protein [Anaerolineales bacterium]